MKLTFASDMRLEECRLFVCSMPILEDGEGPKWNFKYDRWQNDPEPDILLLGSYRHPNTGNDLVGGINLHYLTSGEVTGLARALPQVMQGRNLYERYWIGKRLIPDVFQEKYRTYNADYIRGVKPGIMYPKYGFLQSTKNWFKKNIGGMLKTRQQREKDAQPKYPDDLQDMQDQLRLVVNRLQQRQQQRDEIDEPPDTPEMQRAREAFQVFQREKLKRARDIQTPDDVELQQSYDDYLSNLDQGRISHPEQPEISTATPGGIQPVPEVPPTRTNMRRAFEQEREDNKAELNDPDNDVELDESIIYYSPITKRYICERLNRNEFILG